ncbi:MAG: 4Fe-4S binding protein [Saprospiraceae bacterium]|nr:4Fe-4S binding protein [Saprospiraceae bacterium]
MSTIKNRLNLWGNLILVLCLTAWNATSFAQQRFPKPDFESGYVQPHPTTPEPRALWLEYSDVLVLIIVLCLAAWFVFKKRSRRGILWVSVFALAYFGFYREGCICPIGSVQNVALSLFQPEYVISLTVLAFFIIPLIVSLFFGRIFCAAACPLGAVQDLLVYNPITLAPWVNKSLGLIPYLYLGLAVLFAATGTDFLICRYDPFVGFFRMDASFLMIVLGVSFLLMGLFIARPYCRFLCPYGVLLNWTSRFSKWHLTITPAECIDCKLCENSCPFDVIEQPTTSQSIRKTKADTRRFVTYALMIPLLVGTGAYLGGKSHVFMSGAHPDVELAELLITQPEVENDPDNIDVQTFLASGKTMPELVEAAVNIRREFYTGSAILGGFLGLVLGFFLINQVIFSTREIYEPNKGNCFSCGRCMDYCPVGKEPFLT